MIKVTNSIFLLPRTSFSRLVVQSLAPAFFDIYHKIHVIRCKISQLDHAIDLIEIVAFIYSLEIIFAN